MVVSSEKTDQEERGFLFTCSNLHQIQLRRKLGQGVTKQVRRGSGQGRAGQGRAGQGRAGQGRAGQGRAGVDMFGQKVVTVSWVGV